MRSKILVMALLVFALPAFATFNKPDPAQGQEQEASAASTASSASDSASSAVSDALSESAAAAEASNEGNSLSVNENYESGPADLILVPNNNTENCLRVFGFAFGNNNGSGMFGIPWRSNACDYEGAADDAFAAGMHDLGWFWKCNNSSLYSRFKDKGESKQEAIEQCHAKALGELSSRAVIAGLKASLKASKENVQFLQEERRIERIKCNDAKNRITEACWGDGNGGK